MLMKLWRQLADARRIRAPDSFSRRHNARLDVHDDAADEFDGGGEVDAVAHLGSECPQRDGQMHFSRPQAGRWNAVAEDQNPGGVLIRQMLNRRITQRGCRLT